MNGDGPVSIYELRRRRLLGCVAMGGFLLTAFALNGWQVTPIWRLLEDREGLFAAGDPYGEWVYAVCNGEEQQVTVLRDGRVEGASALDSLRTMRFPDWCSSLPTVDNPELADWQSRFRDFQALTANAASAAPILDAAERLPISAMYLNPIAEWLRDETHAVSFLDTLADRPMRFNHPDRAIEREQRANFAGLIGKALDVATRSDVTSAELERWLTSRQITSSEQAMLKLASLGSLSIDASAMVLQRLESLPREQRTHVYLALAPELVHRGEYTALVSDQLQLLPRRDRAGAAQQLLALTGGSVEFPIALLSILERGFNGSEAELQLFTAIADRIRDEPDAPALLTRHLDDLGPMQRRLGATHLVGLDRPGDTAFTLSVLGAFGDLHPMSQPKLISALLQSPQFADRSVQEACLLAIQLQVRGPARAELLATMARHPEVDRDLQSRINAAIASAAPQGERGTSL